MGRGGVGKTSFVAFMAKYFLERRETPLLLVDADPDENLAEMIGVDFHAEGKETISELLTETFKEEGGTTIGIPPSERIESRIWSEGMYEGDDFDFIAVGTKWVEGCYCLPNAALKRALATLTGSYAYVLVDSPAGLEHLNRRVTPEINDLFILLDPSKKAFNHVTRAVRIINEIGVQYNNIYLVGGYRFPIELQHEAEQETRLRYLGSIDHDQQVADSVTSGASLLDLPSDTPAYVSIIEVLRKAGY